MSDQPIRVLLVGDFHRAEMQPVARAVHKYAAGCRIEHCADFDSAVEWITAGNGDADLVIVLQEWPDQFSQAQVRKLLSLLPLARWICCFGLWCESDGRNRDIWPLSVRVPARTAEARIQSELGVLRGKLPPLPLTASRDEIFEFDACGSVSLTAKAAGSPGMTPSTHSVAVDTPDVELGRRLIELLRSGGYRVATSGREGEAPAEPKNETELAAIVWDVDPWRHETAEKLRDFCRRNPNVAVVALMNFASPEDVSDVKACGADAVVAKLAPGRALLETIATTTARKRNRAAFRNCG